MWRIGRRFEMAGLSLQEFGQRMGYGQQTARKSAWQFLNATADPRLSMIEKAASALGCSIGDLVSPLSVAASHPDLAAAIADHYLAVASDVARGITRDEAIKLLTRGTDSVLNGQAPEVKKLWDRWRIRTGQILHSGPMSKDRYAAALREVATQLRVDAAEFTP
jgi:transcriptional regulator with XRE-family HTH domain